MTPPYRGRATKGDKVINTDTALSLTPFGLSTVGLDLVPPREPCAQAHGLRIFLIRPRDTGVSVTNCSKTRSGDYVNGSSLPFQSCNICNMMFFLILCFKRPFLGCPSLGPGSHRDGEPKHQNQAIMAFRVVCQGFEGNWCSCRRYRSAVPNNSRYVSKVNTFLTVGYL